MAGASIKAIKSRISSVENTMQITKAMELVASSKLRRAKENAEKAAPFFEIQKEAIAQIILSSSSLSSPFLADAKGERTCYIVIAGDRGLAGGYNSNLFKLVRENADFSRDIFLPIGKKSVEQYSRYRAEKVTDDYEIVAAVGVGDSFDIGKLITEKFLAGEFDRACIVYTKFLSMMRQEPVIEQILPLTKDMFTSATAKPSGNITIYEPDEESVLNQIIPQYVSGVIYTAVRQSFASECASRRTAMNAANKNAGEMINDLTLHYNRARQAAITQEITEIVSGSEAL